MPETERPGTKKKGPREEGSPASSPAASLVGVPLETLTALFRDLGQPAYRARQLWSWIYRHGADDFAAMTPLPKGLRRQLAERYSVCRPAVVDAQVSRDGTRKWLLRLADGAEIETVFIPEAERGTVCVSSQVGCTLSCRFCHTGTQAWVRNLTAGEILLQVLLVLDCLDDWGGYGSAQGGASGSVLSVPRRRQVTNVVLMGMGEPLFNYDSVAAAIRILLDESGLGLSRRRITLSTVGVVPQMARLGAELGVNLAISLHAVEEAVRSELVPLNRKYPIAALLEACRNYPAAGWERRLTFEYVLLAGVNDSPEDAARLALLLAGLPAKVNVIPYNPWPGSPYAPSSPAATRRFSERLQQAGLEAPVRSARGQDILAACGQLRSRTNRQRQDDREVEAGNPGKRPAGKRPEASFDDPPERVFLLDKETV